MIYIYFFFMRSISRLLCTCASPRERGACEGTPGTPRGHNSPPRHTFLRWPDTRWPSCSGDSLCSHPSRLLSTYTSQWEYRSRAGTQGNLFGHSSLPRSPPLLCTDTRCSSRNADSRCSQISRPLGTYRSPTEHRSCAGI